MPGTCGGCSMPAIVDASIPVEQIRILELTVQPDARTTAETSTAASADPEADIWMWSERQIPTDQISTRFEGGAWIDLSSWGKRPPL
jgi:hypothetical protein